LKRIFRLRIPREKLLVFLLLLSFLSLVSLICVYSTQQLPTEVEQTLPLGIYSHVGNFTYIANLRPNTIYNKTTLKPGEGTIYLRITESINTTFSYKFQIFQLGRADITTEHSTSVYLSTAVWSKQIDTFGSDILTFTDTTTGQFSVTYLVNVFETDEMVKTINTEIGASATSYNVTISPRIHTLATASAGTIDEYFNPALTIHFYHATVGGDYATVEGLQHNNSGILTKTTRKIYQEWVVLQRYASYAFAITSFSALALLALAFRKNRPSAKTEEQLFKKIIKPYKEIIVQAGNPPQEERMTTVTMKTLEDLAKVADQLGRPIIHNEKTPTKKDEKSTHVFYVLDGLTKYEYTVTAASAREK